MINSFCKFRNHIEWRKRRFCQEIPDMILLYFIGSAALSSGNIKPRTIPDMANMSYVLKIRNQNISVPLNQPRKLWALREFNPRLPLVMVITGWTTNANDTNPALDVIWPAYRCRGNVNFVVSFQIKTIINNFQWILLLIQRQFFAGTVIRLLTPVSSILIMQPNSF